VRVIQPTPPLVIPLLVPPAQLRRRLTRAPRVGDFAVGGRHATDLPGGTVAPEIRSIMRAQAVAPTHPGHPPSRPASR
jgi:hypothetical protein